MVIILIEYNTYNINKQYTYTYMQEGIKDRMSLVYRHICKNYRE